MRRRRVLLPAAVVLTAACATTAPGPAAAALGLDDVAARLRAGGVPCDGLSSTRTDGVDRGTCTTPVEHGASTSLVLLAFPPGPPRTVYTGSYVPFTNAVVVTGPGFEVVAPEQLADRVARATGGHRPAP